jgi:hypothetical protein
VIVLSDPNFSISYPSDWTQGAASAGTGVSFTGTGGQTFQVTYLPGQADPATVVNSACQGANGTGSKTSNVKIGGQQWVQEPCLTSGASVQLEIEAVNYKGNIYLIVYGSPSISFNDSAKNYFRPMEQSFQFLV